MAFVDYHQIVFGEEVEQTIRTSARFATIEITAVILDSCTMSELANHLNIIGDAFVQTFCFELFTLTLKESDLSTKVFLNLNNGPLLSILGGHEEVGWIHLIAIVELNAYKKFRIKLFYTVYFIVPKGYAKQEITICEGDIYCISFDTIFSSTWRDVVTDIKQFVKSAKQVVSVEFLTDMKFQETLVESRRIAHSVDARHTAHHNDIRATRE